MKWDVSSIFAEHTYFEGDIGIINQSYYANRGITVQIIKFLQGLMVASLSGIHAMTRKNTLALVSERHALKS